MNDQKINILGSEWTIKERSETERVRKLEQYNSISESDYVNDLVDKIASFFERDENWGALKGCWLVNGRSNDFRKLLHAALKEVDLSAFESED